MRCDVVIIGAGVVGLACAERLTRQGRGVLVVERQSGFGRETSSRNSEVIHAGLYYPTGSRKARLCVAGNASLYAWCLSHRVSHAAVGKLVVAVDDGEEAALEALLARGRDNGVPGLSPLTAAEVRTREPRVCCRAAVWSATTGIVDSHAFMASLLAEAKARRCDVAYRHEVTAIERRPDGYRLTVRDPTGEVTQVDARAVVNAAGLDADRVAALAGVDVAAAGYALTYVRGRYFRLRGPSPVRCLVYPMPPVGLSGLGIHVTVDLGGSARVGPDVDVLAGRTQDYDVDPAVAPTFHRAVRRYLEGLELEDLSPDQAGIRPKLTLAGGGAPDFVVAEETSRGLPGLVNLVGIESPGLTASLEIAGEVAELLP